MHHSLLHPEHLLSTHQGEISDLPRFCLFYISFGLEVIALALSTVADVSPEDEELVKRVSICTNGSIISYCGIHNKVENIIHTIRLLIWNCLYSQNPEAGAVFLSRITFNWFNRWVKSCYIVNPPHMCRLWLSSSAHPTSMVVKGYKRPLVQEDMWDLNEIDSTAYINQRFQYFMQPELAAARVRYQKQMKKKQEKNKDKAQDAAFQNGLSNGLGKGVSQDVLMMVRMRKMDFIFQHFHYIGLNANFFSLGGEGKEGRWKEEEKGQKEGRRGLSQLMAGYHHLQDLQRGALWICCVQTFTGLIGIRQPTTPEVSQLFNKIL